MAIEVDGASRIFPIIGDPIQYVRSPELLSATLQSRGYNGVCVPLQVDSEGLAPIMAALSVAANVNGVLVTMPHKSAMFSYCATASIRASRFGAVSVIRRNPDRTWHGEMLDGLAFVKAQRDHGARIEGKRALLLGAGGAGSAIAFALLDGGVAELMIHDADADRARRVVSELDDLGGLVTYGPADPTGFDLVFNATPVGLRDGDPVPLDPSSLRAGMFVGDVIAGHGITPLIAAARRAGCATATGDDMVEAVQEVMADFLIDAPR